MFVPWCCYIVCVVVLVGVGVSAYVCCVIVWLCCCTMRACALLSSSFFLLFLHTNTLELKARSHKPDRPCFVCLCARVLGVVYWCCCLLCDFALVDLSVFVCSVVLLYYVCVVVLVGFGVCVCAFFVLLFGCVGV